MSKKSFRQLKNKSKILWIGLAVLIALTVILAVFLPKDTEKQSADAAEPDEVTGYAADNVYTEEYTWNEETLTGNFYYVNTQSNMPPQYIINFDFNTTTYTQFYLFEGKVEPISIILPSGTEYTFTNQQKEIGKAVNLWTGSRARKGKIIIKSLSYNAKFILYRGTDLAMEPGFINALYAGFGYGEECEEKGINVSYKSGYDNGYLAGEKDGNQSGYQEGLEQAQYGIFNGALVDVKYTYDGTNYFTKTDLKPDFFNGGIYFKSIYNEIKTDSDGNLLENCTLTIKVVPFIYDTSIHVFYGLGFGLNSPSFYTMSGKSYDSNIEDYAYLKGYKYEIKDGQNIISFIDSPINKIEMYLGNATDTLQAWQLCVTGDDYTSGYNAGFGAGKETSYNNGYNDGYSSGRKVGYDDGYNTGYSKGIIAAGDYTFLSLMTSVVDAPVKAFMGLLDFEILGVNISGFILTLLSLALLLKIISVFSKGR